MKKNRDRACLIGQRCDFYIFIERDGETRWSKWLKGKDAVKFWDKCMQIKDGDTFKDTLLNKYNELKDA